MTAADLARVLSRRDSKLYELRRRHMALVSERRSLERLLAGPPHAAGAGSLAPPVRAGDFARTTPFSLDWGADRGRCIDRYYIEAFLAQHAADIRGAVLEVHDDDYTKQFGGACVVRSDVLDIDPSNPRATVVADLRDAPAIPSDSYECIVLTQTLHLIYDTRAVLRECRRILRPGGVLLATLPAASRVAPEYGPDGDHWRFTPASAARLFGECFRPGNVHVRAYGNVLTNVAFLYGLACHELTDAEFEDHDPSFPLIVAVRAVKPHA